MENVNEDFFLPEDIQTEIEKKVKEAERFRSQTKTCNSRFLWKEMKTKRKAIIISVILNSPPFPTNSVNICLSPKRIRPVPRENWQKIALSMAIKN